uniref:FAD-dependent oxidoreductase domain-containing protein 1 n=1 Tax=Rhizophora mucronata TaxID=61149 RepID=A0A2P2NIP4_RHIMU
MVHKSPESDTWDLAMRSHRLWKMFAETVRDQGLDPFQALGWKKNGSLLVGRTHEESEMLKRRVKLLCEAGLRAEYLSSGDLQSEEPELWVGEEGGAAFVPDDCQLDAMRSVAIIEKANRQYASKGRYAEFYHDPVTRLLRCSGSGKLQGVQTSKNVLYSDKAIIVAAGCWSGSLVHDLFRELDVALEVPVKPRKGNLLVLENFSFLKLNHGLMEMGYVDHVNGKNSETSASGPADQAKNLSVSMVATMDTSGGLVLGKILKS